MQFLIVTSLISLYSMHYINKAFYYAPLIIALLITSTLIIINTITFTESFGILTLYFFIPFFCISWVLSIVLRDIPFIKKFLDFIEPKY